MRKKSSTQVSLVIIHNILVRLKYKKDHKTQEWITSNRPFRNIWLILFEKCDIHLPKYSLEKLEPKQIQASYELNKPTFRPNITKTLAVSKF